MLVKTSAQKFLNSVKSIQLCWQFQLKSIPQHNDNIINFICEISEINRIPNRFWLISFFPLRLALSSCLVHCEYYVCFCPALYSEFDAGSETCISLWYTHVSSLWLCRTVFSKHHHCSVCVSHKSVKVPAHKQV